MSKPYVNVSDSRPRSSSQSSALTPCGKQMDFSCSGALHSTLPEGLDFFCKKQRASMVPDHLPSAKICETEHRVQAASTTIAPMPYNQIAPLVLAHSVHVIQSLSGNLSVDSPSARLALSFSTSLPSPKHPFARIASSLHFAQGDSGATQSPCAFFWHSHLASETPK